MWVLKCGSCGLVVGVGWRCAGLGRVSGHAGREGAWGFWGSFGLRAAHGQGKYALAVPAATTEFWKSAQQLPSGNFAR